MHYTLACYGTLWKLMRRLITPSRKKIDATSQEFYKRNIMHRKSTLKLDTLQATKFKSMVKPTRRE